MAIVNDMIHSAMEEGYLDENAEVYVCQNLVLLALSKSSLSRNATIKMPDHVLDEYDQASY